MIFCDCGYYNNSDFESDCGFEFGYNNYNGCEGNYRLCGYGHEYGFKGRF